MSDTVDVLNGGARVPAEILVCIPQKEAPRVAALAGGNVRVVVTECRGQVAQRAFGLARASEALVLQLDDDILLHSEQMRSLVTELQRLGPGNVVAPIYRDAATGRCLHAYARGLSGNLQHVYARIICGARWGLRRMGTVSPAGVSYGVDESLCTAEPMQTEWLPGGCVLSYRDDLVLESFFPFPGKAFCEDLLHSLLRRRRGLRLWVLPRVYCMTPAAPPQTFTLSSMVADLRVRRHVVLAMGGSQWRLALWFLADSCRRAATSLFGSIVRKVG